MLKMKLYRVFFQIYPKQLTQTVKIKLMQSSIFHVNKSLSTLWDVKILYYISFFLFHSPKYRYLITVWSRIVLIRRCRLSSLLKLSAAAILNRRTFITSQRQKSKKKTKKKQMRHNQILHQAFM